MRIAQLAMFQILYMATSSTTWDPMKELGWELLHAEAELVANEMVDTRDLSERVNIGPYCRPFYVNLFHWFLLD